MNLDNLNLVELNAQEKKETEGGLLPILIVGSMLWGMYCGYKDTAQAAS